VIPPIPSHRPQIGDEGPLGVSFFRTWVGVGRPFGLQPSPGLPWEDVPEHDLENLTLPRTFFGRSEIGPISFQNTDLSESTLCWNDFIEVNFTDADLSESDLRASIFRRVAFVRTNLRNADLRRSSFEASDFTDADMAGAKLTRKQGERIHLSNEQRKVIDWQGSDGEEPPGG
jgi:BTB/POZ domain-containing protein KCTD9